ncbi:hypothetical protein LTR27_012447 [Elasticomyces elasticus]|nr:hypothetical protein LTR27_012447 [Elasticomyces elasticus]
MDKSPLSLLPPELRNLIYEIALHEPDGIVLETAQGKLTAPANTLALARTCRRLRNETHELFFDRNDFTVNCHYFSFGDAPDDISIFGFNGETAARRMDSICLDLGAILADVDPTAHPHAHVFWREGLSQAISGLILSMVETGWFDWDSVRPDLRLSFVVHICISEHTAEVAYDLPLNDAVEVRRMCQAAVDADREGQNTGLLVSLFEQDVVVPVLEDVMHVLCDAPKTRLLCFR